MRYALVAICSECDHLAGPDPHEHRQKFRRLCQSCGMDPGRFIDHYRGGTGHWRLERRRWESRGVWWKPWTWGRGSWVPVESAEAP